MWTYPVRIFSAPPPPFLRLHAQVSRREWVEQDRAQYRSFANLFRFRLSLELNLNFHCATRHRSVYSVFICTCYLHKFL